MKILYCIEYYNRILYVIEINYKVTMLYKSSGLSSTGHKDKFLPFMYVCDIQRLSEPLGYIYKEMLYDKKYINHHKNLADFPGTQEKIDKISKFIKSIIPPETSPERITQFYVDKVYNSLRECTKDREFFDYKLDNIKD